MSQEDLALASWTHIAEYDHDVGFRFRNVFHRRVHPAMISNALLPELLLELLELCFESGVFGLEIHVRGAHDVAQGQSQQQNTCLH